MAPRLHIFAHQCSLQVNINLESKAAHSRKTRNAVYQKPRTHY